jgi:hypothetical protein
VSDGVELVGRVRHGRLVALALLGDRVHDHRCAIVLRLPQGLLQGADVMAVHGADVLDVEVGVERLVVGEAAQEAVGAATDAPVQGPAGRTEEIEEAATGGIEAAVGAPGSHVVEEARHPPDGRRIRAPVVIDDDDETTVVVVADVVQRLPRHPAGERAVAHDGDHVPIRLPRHLECAGDAVRPGQAAGGMGALDDVVDALRTARVAREATRLPQAGEVLSTGQQLVHVRLVPGVPHDRVAR